MAHFDEEHPASTRADLFYATRVRNNWTLPPLHLRQDEGGYLDAQAIGEALEVDPPSDQWRFLVREGMNDAMDQIKDPAYAEAIAAIIWQCEGSIVWCEDDDSLPF